MLFAYLSAFRQFALAEDAQAAREAQKQVQALQDDVTKLKKLVQILTSDLDEEVSDGHIKTSLK